MKPNTQFNLSVKDIELIEKSLRVQMRKLNILKEKETHRVQSIEAKLREINELLGRIHNQKNFYRPGNRFNL